MNAFDWSVIGQYAGYVAAGIPITLLVSAGAVVIGIVLGVPIAILRLRAWAPVRWLLLGYVELFRNTPVLVQVVWFYYVLPVLTGGNLPPVWAGTLAIGLNTSAYIAEAVRGGIVGIASGQGEAARCIGMSYWQSMRWIILPQTSRRMLVPFANTFVVVIKESALVSYIGVLDILHRGDVVQVSTFKPLEAYTLVAVFFLIVITAVTQLMRFMEKRWSPAVD
ncbi:amino acid ABC transporter permease [Pseudonocardia oroxyli]|uniref:Amino acid ABC transporter membrane protein, PAAT family n=1 Tax=Pseudonocardia oroxyli TaxID=366584 RepID=A0A1G7Y204_PSEOR|nr:amino acid ABC transporter permease [Pseudonocardia oroxyli]SDG90478.1 amino acid ABC transporter membrane protein, PAAT family [Pseudonocardia oroxyli]